MDKSCRIHILSIDIVGLNNYQFDGKRGKSCILLGGENFGKQEKVIPEFGQGLDAEKLASPVSALLAEQQSTITKQSF